MKFIIQVRMGPGQRERDLQTDVDIPFALKAKVEGKRWFGDVYIPFIPGGGGRRMVQRITGARFPSSGPC